MNAARQSSVKWSDIQEKRVYLGLKILVMVYRVFGAWAMDVLLCFVVGAYFIFGTRARAASLMYLRNMHQYMGSKSLWRRRPGLWLSFQHFMSFGHAAADKVTVWMGRYKVEDVTFHHYDEYKSIKDQGRGTLIIASHLGNVDICRALGAGIKKIPMTVLVHNAHAPHFHRILSDVSGCPATINIIDVRNITPDVAIILKSKIEAGEDIILTGDRTAAVGDARYETIPFLGKDAHFAQGPFILARLLECPVLVLFSIKKKDGYHVFFEKFSDSLVFSRADRPEKLAACVQKYAGILERYACLYPLQWFNFYDYWAIHHDEDLNGK